MPELKLSFAANSFASKRTGLERQVVITLDGIQKRVDRVRLDSGRSRSDLATRVQKDFGVPCEETACQLDCLSLAAAGELQVARKAALDDKSLPRLSQLADKWLEDLKPKHHRKSRTIYLESVGREIPITCLWRLLENEAVDAVADTQEGREISPNGQKPPHQKLLSLMREAVTMAAERVIRELPELDVAECEDPTTDPEELVQRLVFFLVKPRTTRSDDGVCYSTTLLAWAESVAAGGHWQRCYSFPVYAQRDPDNGCIMIAVVGAFLVEELNYKSNKRLASDLKHAKLAQVNYILKFNGRSQRTWLLAERALQAISDEASPEQAVPQQDRSPRP